jgi:hypothetical protein
MQRMATLAQGSFGAELHQGMVGLKPEYHAGEKAHQHDNGYGPGANVVDLLNDSWELSHTKYHEEGFGKKDGCSAQIVDQIHRFPAHSGERPGQYHEWSVGWFVCI